MNYLMNINIYANMIKRLTAAASPPRGVGYSHPEVSPGVPAGECQRKPDEPESGVSTR